MFLLGIDVGSSSVKASLLEAESGRCAAAALYPETELKIDSPRPGYAEQNPQSWYECAVQAVSRVMHQSGVKPETVAAIGLAYQMHGLVCVDRNRQVLRPAIIWCDSRAVSVGQSVYAEIGPRKCLQRLLNSPGNFTAAKLAWVKNNEPDIYKKIDKIMLPGDWLAMRLTGEPGTTVSGLSEGIFWDFRNEQMAGFLLDALGLPASLLPPVVPGFGVQGLLTSAAAADFGLRTGTPITYRAGDQPNNALSLNVLRPGEIAATAGTSGVVYGVTDQKRFDPLSRVNTFAHVNHRPDEPRLGVLLCINGAGVMNAWTRRLLGDVSYPEMNDAAASVPGGSEGLMIMPFGNGAERMLCNRTIGAHVAGLDLNRHSRAHLCRAVQEGVVFSFRYGLEIMKECGIAVNVIRAGFANMFMSDVFCQALAGVSGAVIELYDVDGALGAARGAGVGAGVYKSFDEAFCQVRKRKKIEPDADLYENSYTAWSNYLTKLLS